MGLLRARCPNCKKPVETAPARRPKEFPFCSNRCRLLDLHRWMQGEYRIPATRGVSDAGEEPGGE